MIVFLERGAAAGGVRHDGVEVSAQEDSEIFSSEIARGIADSGVGGEGPAAQLAIGHDDFATVGGEHTDGSFIEFRKGDVGDASSEEGYARAAFTGGRKSSSELAEEKGIINRREQALAFRKAEKFEDAARTSEGLQPGALIEAQEARCSCDAPGMRQELAEHQVARKPREERAFIVAFDARAGMFDELAVFDAGGAGGFTGPAVQAFVDVIDEGIGDRQFVLFDGDHLVDAAAGGIGFEVPQTVSGASVEAQAAVDAASIVLVDGVETRNSGRRHSV